VSADNRIRTRENSHLADVMGDTLVYLESPFSDLILRRGFCVSLCILYILKLIRENRKQEGEGFLSH